VLDRASRIASPIGIPRLLFITRNNRRVRGLPAVPVPDPVERRAKIRIDYLFGLLAPPKHDHAQNYGCQHGARQANGSRVHQIVSFLERCPVLAGVSGFELAALCISASLLKNFKAGVAFRKYLDNRIPGVHPKSAFICVHRRPIMILRVPRGELRFILMARDFWRRPGRVLCSTNSAFGASGLLPKSHFRSLTRAMAWESTLPIFSWKMCWSSS
jgi:hypothetical protein